MLCLCHHQFTSPIIFWYRLTIVVLEKGPQTVVVVLSLQLFSTAFKTKKLVFITSSSRMRVIYHNWSAMKQRPHPQSVAEISHHSVSSGGRIRQCETPSGPRHKDTDQCLQAAISLRRHCSVPVPCENGSAETTVADLFITDLASQDLTHRKSSSTFLNRPCSFGRAPRPKIGSR